VHRSVSLEPGVERCIIGGMARLTLLVAVGMWMPLTALAASPPIGYAQSTDSLERTRKPALYTALNLLDGRETTAWCASDEKSAGAQKITFGFKGPVTLDEIRVYTGNGTSGESFAEFARAKKLTLSSNLGARSLVVADQRGQQAVPLRPPLSGAEFTLEISETYPGQDASSPVCLTDVVFYADGKPLNGSWLTPKLKFDKPRDKVLGTWFSGFEGAPERFLSFYFDRTFRFVYEPIDPSKQGYALSGEYEVSGTRVVLSLSGKGKASAKLADGAGGPGSGRTLTFEDSAPEDFKEPFRDQK